MESAGSEESQSTGVRIVMLSLPEDEGEGLGFKLTRTLWDPYPWIRDVTAESRAAAAGLRTGDCLLQAEGNDLLGLPISKVAGLIRGDGEGREVSLLVWSCGVDPDDDPELLWSGGGAGSDRPRRALGGVLRALSCAVCGATVAAALSCRRAHLYCDGCWSRLERCALCREALPAKDSPYAKNLVAQQVFEAIAKEYDIKFKANKTQMTSRSPSRSPKISPTASRRGQYHLSMMARNRVARECSSDPNINRTKTKVFNDGNTDNRCHCQKVTKELSQCSCQNLLQHTLVTRLRETNSLADLKCSAHSSLSKSLNNVSLKEQSTSEAQQSSSMENLGKFDAPVFLLAPPPIYFLVTEHSK